ncbi:MAG: hypothetical protein EOP86_09110, partial [Verrucomicrobiaceae bacterium]
MSRPDQMAAEIRITALTLFQQGLVPEITGLEIRGSFPESDAADFEPGDLRHQTLLKKRQGRDADFRRHLIRPAQWS